MGATEPGACGPRHTWSGGVGASRVPGVMLQGAGVGTWCRASEALGRLLPAPRRPASSFFLVCHLLLGSVTSHTAQLL